MHGVHIFLMVGAFVQFSLRGYGWKSTSGHVGHQELIKSSNTSLTLPKLTVGLIVPHTSFSVREYTRAINRAVGNVHKGHARTKKQTRFSFLDKYDFNQQPVRHTMMRLTPSPTGKYFYDWLNFEKNTFIRSFADITININILRFLSFREIQYGFRI